MAKRLNQDSIKTILTNPDLYASVSKILGVLPSSLPNTLNRNGNAVNRHDNIEAIAQALGKSVTEIQEEVEPATA